MKSGAVGDMPDVIFDIDQLERKLKRAADVCRLGRIDLAKYGGDYQAGICLRGLFAPKNIDLILLIPKHAPFQWPRVAIDGKDISPWPHVEKTNLLCLPNGNDSGFAISRYEDCCIYALRHAKQLMQRPVEKRGGRRGG